MPRLGGKGERTGNGACGQGLNALFIIEAETSLIAISRDAAMVTFGHRHSMELPDEAPSAHAAAAAHGGLGEDDSIEALTLRLDASREGMERRLAHQIEVETKRHAQPVRLFSLMLIPDPVWRGRHGKFLLHTLALNPYDPWNVLIAPSDAESAALVEAPTPPSVELRSTLARCNELLAAARQRYADALDLTDWANDFSNVEKARLAGREEVHALAMELREQFAHAHATEPAH